MFPETEDSLQVDNAVEVVKGEESCTLSMDPKEIVVLRRRKKTKDSEVARLHRYIDSLCDIQNSMRSEEQNSPFSLTEGSNCVVPPVLFNYVHFKLLGHTQNNVQNGNAFDDRLLLRHFRSFVPEDHVDVHSLNRQGNDASSSIRTLSANEDCIESYNYSLCAYIENVVNALMTNSFLIDPEQPKLCSESRIEVKAFIVTTLSCIRTILANGFSLNETVPDADSEVCLLCFHPFSTFRRRHHCSNCGRLLCSICCNKKIGHSVGVHSRLCMTCYLLIKRMPSLMRERIHSLNKSEH